MCVEVASDGAVVRGQHLAVHHAIRCLDAPAEFMVSKRNVKTILVIPGPSASKDNTGLLLHARNDSVTMAPCLYSRRRCHLKDQVGVVLHYKDGGSSFVTGGMMHMTRG